jgi:hypothetical protein
MKFLHMGFVGAAVLWVNRRNKNKVKIRILTFKNLASYI